MVGGSQVSACHISSWFMAVLGLKLQPTSQWVLADKSLACCVVHWGRGERAECGNVEQPTSSAKKAREQNRFIIKIIRKMLFRVARIMTVTAFSVNVFRADFFVCIFVF